MRSVGHTQKALNFQTTIMSWPTFWLGACPVCYVSDSGFGTKTVQITPGCDYSSDWLMSEKY